ncbi:MAG: hypothetical protein K1X75_07960 [Leptospirales bacterium]|nr:hypothetical protein [Leptospirales bacterium]
MRQTARAPDASRALLWAALWIALSARLAAQQNWDSLWAFASVAPAGLIALALLTGLAALLSTRFADRIKRLTQLAHQILPLRWQRLAAALLFVALAGLLFLLRMRLFLPPPRGLGDSLLIVEHLELWSRTLGYLDSLDELLEYFLRSKLYLWCYARWSCSVENSYAALSLLFFVPWALVLWRFLCNRPLGEQLLGLALFVGTPALQLFAGYVENYTAAMTAMTAVCLPAARYLETPASSEAADRRLLLFAAVVFATGCLFHLYVATLGPALVVLTLELGVGRGWRGWMRRTLTPAAISAAMLVAVIGYFVFLEDPPIALGASHASNPPIMRPGLLFSMKRIGWLWNELTMASPAWLPWLVIALGAARKQARLQGSSMWRTLSVAAPNRFALSALAGCALLTLVWTPAIGYPADWDLKTLFQTPLHLLLFYWLRDRLNDEQARHILLPLPSLAFCALLFSGSWLWRNAQSTEESQRALQRAHANAAEAVQRTVTDPIFVSLTDVERKRTYLQLRIFFIRSRRALEGGVGAFDADTREEYLRQTRQGERDFEAWMVLPPAEYEANRARLWSSWSRLNRTINGP